MSGSCGLRRSGGGSPFGSLACLSTITLSLYAIHWFNRPAIFRHY
jgi:hypothetical protein